MYKLLERLFKAALSDDPDGEQHFASPTLRYETLLMALLDHVHNNLSPEDTAIADIAEEIPSLTQSFLDSIRV